MAAADTQTNQISGSGFGGYDPKAFKNYAAMSAMYWPGFDSAGYAAAAQASALAAAATTLSQQSAFSQGVTNGTNTATTPTSLVPPQTFTDAKLGMFNNPQTAIVSTTTTNLPVSFPAHSTTPSTPIKKKAIPVPVHMKDDTYWDRRKRNNESARRSRESRRQKEEGMAFRVVYLEQENLRLHTELSMLRSEIEKLRMLVYSPAHH